MAARDMWRYRICGLAIRSEVELPGAVPEVSTADEPDVTIRKGSVPRELADTSAQGPNWFIAGDRFLLQVPDVARFLVTAGHEIVVQSESGADERDAAVFLVSSALSILLHQRGRIVLHASAVSVGGRAVLFCGPSGAGKSTLAATLTARGYPFVNDDVCCVSAPPGERPVVLPDGRLLKLWEDALEHLQISDRKGQAVRTELRKFYVPPERTVTSPLPIAAIYVLREEHPPFKRGIERPNAVDAAQILRQSAHRPALVNHMRLDQVYFFAAANLLRAAGVFMLTKPRDLQALPEVVATIEAHWRDLGFLDMAA